MLGPLLLRVGSQVLHSVMGGFSVFCFYYSLKIPDPAWLVMEGGKWGILAWLVLFCQCKYLDQK